MKKYTKKRIIKEKYELKIKSRIKKKVYEGHADVLIADKKCKEKEIQALKYNQT